MKKHGSLFKKTAVLGFPFFMFAVVTAGFTAPAEAPPGKVSAAGITNDQTFDNFDAVNNTFNGSVMNAVPGPSGSAMSGPDQFPVTIKGLALEGGAPVSGRSIDVGAGRIKPQTKVPCRELSCPSLE